MTARRDPSPQALERLHRRAGLPDAPVHLIGIGGAGMSVIAMLLAAHGVEVQGSDAKDSPVLAGLRDAGVQVWVGHDAAHAANAGTVVISSAVKDANPELVAARAAAIPVWHRSQALASIMALGTSIAVAGAHGKTTASAMIATALQAAGLDPSWAVGSTVFTGGVVLPGGHRGTGSITVVEADESDGSFLNYAPDVELVTNVEPDHLDHYGSREEFEQAFVDFADRITPGGTLVACVDDPGAAALARQVRASGARVVTYGTCDQADLRIRGIRASAGGGISAVLEGHGMPDGGAPVRLRVPGEHNIRNAAGAVAVAMTVGVGPLDAIRGVEAFGGTGRRFELKGEAGGVRVVDDYAHHPTEVAALLHAARPVAGEGRLLVLFQPHLFSRTRAFARQFAQALDLADVAVVTGVYAAREAPDGSVGPHTITTHMTHGRAVADKVDAAQQIAAAARPGDLILTVGAGDVTELGPRILELLAATGS